MSAEILQSPVAYVKGVGPVRAQVLLQEMGIGVCQDLLHFFPTRYIDRTRYFKINELHPNDAEVQIVGVVTKLRNVSQKRGSRLVATFEDKTGKMELVWFRGAKWIQENIKLHTPYVIFGKTKYYNGYSMPHPDMELLDTHKANISNAMQAVYPSSEKLQNKNISHKTISKMVQNLFLTKGLSFPETLSPAIIDHLKLIGKSEALLNIHFPKSQELLTKASYRLKFEELFYIQLQLIRKNILQKQKIKGYPFEKVGELFTGFYEKHLPFELTGAQKRVIKEVRRDLGSHAQMNRLLQGDVGSGKTIVALMTMLLAIDNGFQATLMAPTAILAKQHYEGISELVKELPITVSLLMGNTKAKARREIHADLENGQIHIMIGTHALLEDKVKFNNLGLAIIDEQHRFGVAQRAKLWRKNKLPPHVLVMTATPIPRTLAMSLYGDLDVSVIDELPPGRKAIQTLHKFEGQRLKVFHSLKQEIEKGRQVYIVYPLIKESEQMDYKDLMDGYESISREFPQPKYQISIVHGQMKAADKDLEMERFVKGETQIMVATTVIEVGVNVPNASVMVIESAERFGLSQLHQLRGRVGRGAEQSYCILMSGFKLSEDSKTRLNTMVQTNDGFEIAEVDLKLRGPGDIMGTQQSGVLNLKIADIVKDNQILKVARAFAQTILKEDPNLELSKHRMINFTYNQLVQHKNIWNYIS